jgi:hypothetical protein
MGTSSGQIGGSGSRQLMRYAGYALALVIGVAAIISGIATGAGWLAGAGAGWLIASVILIVKRQSATVQPSSEPDLQIVALFDDVPFLLWVLTIGLIAVGGVLGYLIKH